MKDADLKEVLNTIFKDQPIGFSINDKTVVVSRKEIPVKLDPVNIRGRVTDSTGTPLAGATIAINDNSAVITDSNGSFSFSAKIGDKITISYVGYKPVTFKVADNLPFQKIFLYAKAGQLNEVVVNTGYQTLDPQKATGSFDQIDNKLLNRSVSTNILDRLNGVTSGLIFNKNLPSPTSPVLNIRGVSTINANPNPLIIIDNFPYDGDLSSINPDDVESITVLKDAAAGAIWGAFSGNGVIVITTKKGKYNQAPKVEINSSMTIGEKPNLYYAPQLSSVHYIQIEEYLFKQGYYDSNLSSLSYPAVSPVVNLLDQRRSGLISSADSAKLINQYASQDSRADVSKYFYQKSVNQKHNINISGGGNNNLYYFSAGYDQNLNNVKRNDFDRITLNGSNTYSFLNKKLEFTSNIYFTKSTTDNNGLTSNGTVYPYLKLTNPDGSAASLPYNYRKEYIDTAGHGNLLDWNYRPLDELNLNSNATSLTEYRINTSLNYKILPGLKASVQYQYDYGNSVQSNLHSAQSFYTRDLINSYAQYDPNSGEYTFPIPTGGILDKAYQTFTSQNIRGQANYDHNWNGLHNLSALAGFEVRDESANLSSNRAYGYDELGSTALIDYQTQYAQTPSYNSSTIPANLSLLGTSNRFVSYFSNLGYTYKDRYVFSLSGRKDESNIFGVRTNQKGVPLWSAGGSWEIDKEAFYHVSWLPYLRLRITNGYQGNVDNALSALVTATVNGNVNPYLKPYSVLTNPPNPDLRWERVNTTNFGIDFSFKPLNGSIEYYVKKSTDLIGTAPVDPTTGVSSFTGNSADMTGRGLDINLNSTNLRGAFKWNTTLLFSYTKDKVTKYLLQPTNLFNAFYTPLVGHPLYAIYAYKWAGLDAVGDPQVYLDGKPSKDYGAIEGSTNYDNLQYIGSSTPTIFGSFRNDFSWKQFSLSANITYKFDYFFRRPSLNYNALFSGSAYAPDKDYVNRWQKPGDETITNIPALSYPDNLQRDQVYQNSSVLIDKGDHIRLQDISIGYDINKRQFPKLPFSNIWVYAYINNIGILWRANKDGIDPDDVPTGSVTYPNPRTYALGLKIGI